MSDANTITIVIPNVFENWENILAVLAGISVLASAIVKMFPTLPAGHWLLPVIKFLSRFVALNRTVKDSEVRANVKPK